MISSEYEMLLTCPNCQNSYLVDDQLYARQGGALCDQCHQPLIPMQNNAGGQPNQWNQQQAQWNQAQAQWNQSQGQWGQDVQWGQQPNSWSQQQAQWNQQQAQWGQQPPLDAQWGQQPPLDAQWGQQPSGGSPWGSQEQWSQMADKPLPTEAFNEVLPPPLPVNHNRSNERTVAIDSAASKPPLPKAGAGSQSFSNREKVSSADDDDWGAWADAKFENSPTTDAPSVPGRGSHTIEVGRPMNQAVREGMTRAIDIQTLHELYHDDVNPITEFFKSLPIRYLIVAGTVLVLAMVGFGISAYLINKPEEVPLEFDEKGDIVEEDAPAPEKTFSDIVRETKALSTGFMPLDDGDDLKSGSLLAVVNDKGIFYNGEKIANVNDAKAGSDFVEKIYTAINKDTAHVNEPIVFLSEGALPMSAVYRIMYSAGVTSRKLLFGGTTTTGVTAIEIAPCKWPDHELVIFGECNTVTSTLKLARTEMILRGERGAHLGMTPEGEFVSELRDEIIDTKINTENIDAGLSYLQSTQSASVLIDVDGVVTFDIFLRSASILLGNRTKTNVNKMFLKRVPLI